MEPAVRELSLCSRRKHPPARETQKHLEFTDYHLKIFFFLIWVRKLVLNVPILAYSKGISSPPSWPWHKYHHPTMTACGSHSNPEQHNSSQGWELGISRGLQHGHFSSTHFFPAFSSPFPSHSITIMDNRLVVWIQELTFLVGGQHCLRKGSFTQY